MTTTLTQLHFIRRYSQATYNKVCEAVFKALVESGKTDKPHSLGFFALTLENPKDGTPVYLFVEASAIREGDRLNCGIVKMEVSDEPMPDEMLDRYNEIKKADLK